MKAVNPHSLLDPVPQNIEVCNEISDLFFVWKELMTNKGEERTDFNSFVTGFFLGTNFALREKYKKLKPKRRKFEL